jgi:hypothetical protein
MINLYWPVYENLENNFNDLTYNIHFDDNQLNVYSSKIIDLILRAASEIESISKELYTLHGGETKQYLKYDEDAIKFLNSKFLIDNKIVILSHANCFLSNKIFYPFKKDTNRNNSSSKTYSWNLAYQNLKHSRAEYLEFGSIKYLIDILAALFVLNVYYKDHVFDIDNCYRPKSFDVRLGSKIFSTNLSVSAGDSIEGTFWENKDFHESMYVVKMKNSSFQNFVNTIKQQEEEALGSILKDSSFIEYANINNITDPYQNFWAIVKGAGIDAHKYLKPLSNNLQYLEYEAVLNKGQFGETPYGIEGYRSIFGFKGNATPDTIPE